MFTYLFYKFFSSNELTDQRNRAFGTTEVSHLLVFFIL